MQKELRLTSGFKVKASDKPDTLIVEGYANTVDKDRSGDVVLESAWRQGGMKNYLTNPIILAFHDHAKPVGKTISHEITDKGLYIAAEISKSATDVYSLVKEGILKTFSVSFMVKDADYEPGTDLFVIKDLELLEISIVSVPANADSTFSVRKSVSDSEYEEMKKYFVQEKEEITEKGVKVETKTEDTTEAIVSSVSKVFESFGDKLIKQLAKQTNTSNEEVEIIQKDIKKEEKLMSVEIKETGVEKLLAEVEKRLAQVENAKTKAESAADEKEAMLKSIEDLRGELSERAGEIESLKKSKMEFSDREAIASISVEEKDNALLLSKLLGRDIKDTTLGKQIISKVNLSDHLGATMADGWEEEFSTRIFNDVRESLIVEPLFQSINMTTPTMRLPINPEAGYGEWIDSTLYKDADTSTGNDKTHVLSDRTLIAYKLAAKEYIGYEEEEDSIIPILPIIRDAVVRRMAKSADRAILLGAGTGTTDPSTSDPITGLAALASAGSKSLASAAQPGIAAGDKVTVSTLQSIRRLLGVWGHNPRDVIYVVSHEAYYDLLEDPDFRTVDMVGVQATILTGQIGTVNGSPVIVSGEFNAKADTETFAVAVNKANFIKGQLRGVTVERDKNIEQQRNILVATRRLGFLQVIDAEGVASGEYKA